MPMARMPTMFFALCAAFFAVTLFSNAAYLRLHAEGLEMRSFLRSLHIKWRDVGPIGGYARRIESDGRLQLLRRLFRADTRPSAVARCAGSRRSADIGTIG